MVNRVNRRAFIKNSIFAAGAVSLGITEITYAGENKSTRWALLSDTHIPADKTEVRQGSSMYNNMQTLMPGVAESKPDGIGITGDIARLRGKVEDYVVVKECVDKLAATAPVYMALGNHDNRKNFSATFPSLAGEKIPVKGKHVTVVNSAPVRLIFLDSLNITNNAAGLLGQAQRKWLDKYLKKSDKRPTIILQHHTFGGSDGALLDDLRFFKVILPHRQVKAVFYGHSHRYRYSKNKDLDLINLPSTAYTFDKKAPIGWVDAKFTATGAVLKLNATEGNKTDDGKFTELKWRV